MLFRMASLTCCSYGRGGVWGECETPLWYRFSHNGVGIHLSIVKHLHRETLVKDLLIQDDFYIGDTMSSFIIIVEGNSSCLVDADRDNRFVFRLTQRWFIWDSVRTKSFSVAENFQLDSTISHRAILRRPFAKRMANIYSVLVPMAWVCIWFGIL